MLLINKIIEGIRAFFGFKRKCYCKITNLQSGDISKLKEGEIQIVKGDTNPKWIKFICPCGCRFEIVLPLMKSRYPHWTIIEEAESVSIHPSIDIKDGCKSHFWIKKNQVIWCD